jgi:1-deoxy-D-xylulose-5-phosphate synthase
MSTILNQINQPSDLRRFSYPELNQLADEIREKLVRRVSANGGHLASSLGVVELTIALHRIFDSPRDKIVWDVGHQSYAHKLLTGRRESFPSLRQYGGLSGFPDPSESPHDAFGGGHASNSISAALGLAVARDLVGENYQVVAVIGDGALGGGMALESLNQAGQLSTRLIVVLNDNGMAISPTVGALAKWFNRLRFSFGYRRAKEGLGGMLNRFPLSQKTQALARRVKGSFKGLLMPTMIWEELGFTYLGPFDGHHVAEPRRARAILRLKMMPLPFTAFRAVITTKSQSTMLPPIVRFSGKQS